MSRAGPTMVLAALLMASPARAAATETGATGAQSARAVDSRRLNLSALSLTTVGMMPSAGVGAALAVGLRWSDVSLSLEPRFAVGLESTPLRNDRTTATLVVGAVRACKHYSALFLCGALQGGKVIFDNAELAMEPIAPWLYTAGIVGGTEVRLTDLVAVRALVELHTVVSRPFIAIDGSLWWASPLFAGVAGLGFVIGPGSG